MSARSKPPMPISSVPGETDRGARGLLLTLPNPSTVGPLIKMFVFVSFTPPVNKNMYTLGVSKKVTNRILTAPTVPEKTRTQHQDQDQHISLDVTD